MKYLIDRPASNHLLAHISHQASLVIPCHHINENYKSPIPPLPTFVNLLVKRSCARTGTLLASLVLLDRLRQRLAHFARGMPCTCQRIFLATLIVTTKVLHDTSPKNKHWTKYAVYFTLPEINLMEKQLLALMNFQLVISEKDMYYSFITYDNTIGRQLPPIIHDRSYIPKSASFNTNYCCQPLPSNNMLQRQQQQQYQQQQQQQQQQQHQQQHQQHQLYHHSNTTRKSSNRKRLNITTSSSSSSLSSMEDLIVTPTTSDMYYNKNNKHSNHNLIFPMKINPY
ncbi:hypothetical protein BD408DRAFT_430172 [Parasitella parasitica]|nr:hypothetical protein BD408DRAFT_430172 [Parasitella parasitica]